mmetsp:Transcript_9795/g.14309  ORF Transcript_9795/g.14309 Transcript_9795/m.14309 type:complete len:106 (+) Transcript_9795:650-967(+)
MPSASVLEKTSTLDDETTLSTKGKDDTTSKCTAITKKEESSSMEYVCMYESSDDASVPSEKNEKISPAENPIENAVETNEKRNPSENSKDQKKCPSCEYLYEERD